MEKLSAAYSLVNFNICIKKIQNSTHGISYLLNDLLDLPRASCHDCIAFLRHKFHLEGSSGDKDKHSLIGVGMHDVTTALTCVVVAGFEKIVGHTGTHEPRVFL